MESASQNHERSEDIVVWHSYHDMYRFFINHLFLHTGFTYADLKNVTELVAWTWEVLYAVCLSICLFVHLFLLVCLSECMPVHLPVYLLICLSFCLFICLSIFCVHTLHQTITYRYVITNI
jgi:hypothetical protein